jgi:hypothetical protein
MDSLTFIVSCYNQCSSLGQNLKTSTYAWENLFAVFVSISGLVLFALLIGNVQVNTLNTDSLELPLCCFYLEQLYIFWNEIIKFYRYLGEENLYVGLPYPHTHYSYYFETIMDSNKNVLWWQTQSSDSV